VDPSDTSAPSFRDLHRPGDPFILANAWDSGSAKMLAALGAQALATSSAAHAFTLGRTDGQVTRDEVLAHAEQLVSATPLPVSGDFESGFGQTAAEVATTVRLAADTGLAGISIEDTAHPSSEPYPIDEAVERVEAAVQAARALPDDFVLLARADGVMCGTYDVDEGINRLQRFEAAGADAVYLPIPPSPEDQRRICESVSVPVNALAVGPLAKLSRAEFGEMGVARISLGSALARLTHQTIFDSARAMFDDGDFSSLLKARGLDVDGLLNRVPDRA
jgi:2-methylisocitrate lyase-like PEP mutase family enzyme